MVEILKSNFEDNISAIESSIRNADFIALDTEFSGLFLSNNLKPSLFDTSQKRYEKLRVSATQFTITQIGLAAFEKDQRENKYHVTAYNAYLFPTEFGPLDTRFTVQASSFGFHRQHNFDFNKMVYEGLSYMNEEKEAIAKKYFGEKVIFQSVERDVDEAAIQSVCSQVSEWYVNSQEGQVLLFTRDEAAQRLRNYVIYSELMSRFPLLSVTIEKDGNLVPPQPKLCLRRYPPLTNFFRTISYRDKPKLQRYLEIIVERVSEETQAARKKERIESQKSKEDKVLSDLLGFSRVFKILKECKKPLLGHNMLLDLLLIYDKFYRPLPAKYSDFKSSLHELFPVIYDTKHMSNTLRKSLKESNLLDIRTSLAELYKVLHSLHGQQAVIHTPSVELTECCKRYGDEHTPHEAGYDAFMCGYVFLRLCHIITFKDYKSSEVIPCPFRRYLVETEPFRNRINLIRADVNHMYLEGDDPMAKRPLLYVQSKQYSYTLDQTQLAKWFSPYGTVDVKLQSRYAALVATGNISCSKDICRAFRKHQEIRVLQYNMWKHSPVIRPLLLAGTLVTSGLCVWALFSNRKPVT